MTSPPSAAPGPDAGERPAVPGSRPVPTVPAVPAVSGDVLARLADVVESRRGGDPERSYVARLLARGEDAVLKKIGEEATETVMAAKDRALDRIVAETADLWFHCLVMLARHGLRPEHVLAELERREGLSGLDEQAARRAAGKAADGTPPAGTPPTVGPIEPEDPTP